MEKDTPHYKLAVVKSLARAGNVRATASAHSRAAVLSLDFVDMVRVVGELNMSEFYKCMTTLSDHKLWQDVYRPQTAVGMVYLKVMIVDDVLLVSFKEPTL